MAARKVRRHPIDVSLRLTSRQAPLDDVVEHLGLPVVQRHRLGEPMAETGPLSRRIADTHYASLAVSEDAYGAGVAASVERVAASVSAQAALVEGLRAGWIEGMIWIAVLGRVPTPTPELPAELVARVAALGLVIFLENYSTWDGEGDAPPKTWLPHPPAGSSDVGAA
ncbi:hypothetical protein [Methylobacterium brachiatum]|uniref:hypothetical protein n=1 Tax=Methylobacterium brachiatum TaxID=269660 RepID=UPI0008EBB6DC|nr:hypothetical protein [Methylobacterium brachiatum]SFJ78228.1 hypothetical protein SAMN02799642_05497 [Methylobacterium brachiatum]